MSDGLENIYGEQANMGRRLNYLETIEDGGSVYAGFKRSISRATTIATSANVVVSRYTTIESGGSLTIKADGEITILS